MPWGVAAAAVGVAGQAYGAKQAGKNQPSSYQTNSINPAIENASVGAVQRAQQLSQRRYTPFQGTRVAGLSGFEQQAGRMAGQYGDQVSANMRQGAPTAADLAPFQNPYLDQVLGNQRRVIGEEYGRQSAGIARNQNATDAFRTGRSDLARSRLDANRLTALGDAEAAGQAGAFDRALGAYNQNQEQQRGAFQTAQGALNSAGLAQRGVTQAGLDFNYGQFLENRDWDVNNMGPLLNAISSARGGSTTTGSMTQGSKDYWGAAAGLVGQGLSIYGDYRKEQQATAKSNAAGFAPFDSAMLDSGAWSK